ncbi:MAG: stage V sporulation protein AC [bacterium]
MKLTNEEYGKLVEARAPGSKLPRNMLRAWLSGGLICCLGQAVHAGWAALGLAEETAAGWTSISLIFLGVLLTGLGVYDKLAKFSGAGTLVPITGFANSMAAPAIEFKTEGLITGTAVKMFTIAGPVIVYGVTASAVYGLILMLI